MELGGDWYDGETGSSLSATMGLRDGNDWWLGVWMLLGAEDVYDWGEVCSGCKGWLMDCDRPYWSMGWYGCTG